MTIQKGRANRGVLTAKPRVHPKRLSWCFVYKAGDANPGATEKGQEFRLPLE